MKNTIYMLCVALIAFFGMSIRNKKSDNIYVKTDSILIASKQSAVKLENANIQHIKHAKKRLAVLSDSVQQYDGITYRLNKKIALKNRIIRQKEKEITLLKDSVKTEETPKDSLIKKSFFRRIFSGSDYDTLKIKQQ